MHGQLATCVTRLERMIRGCDAFIGIYPFPGDDVGAPPNADLLRESRYFRLELDLAIRSGKPAIVFFDRRYGHLLYSPAITRFYDFDTREDYHRWRVATSSSV